MSNSFTCLTVGTGIQHSKGNILTYWHENSEHSRAITSPYLSLLGQFTNICFLLLLSFFPPKCEENTSLADCSRYLKMPFSKANLPSNNQTLKGTKESFWITSFLCSTKLTQNGKLRLRDIATLATGPLRGLLSALLELLSHLKLELSCALIH